MSTKEIINSWSFTKTKLIVLLLLCFGTGSIYGQSDQDITLNIGDTAPPLRVKNWLKGFPITKFEKGMVYVVEFWATWCAPCKAAIPHLLALANKYKDKVMILGVDILENENVPMQKIKNLVDSMGNQPNYSVATEEGHLMETTWYRASGEKGIPKSFVVNSEGKLAWIGHPKDLADILPKIINNTWSTEKALNKRNSDRYLRALDDSLNYELMTYRENDFEKDYRGKPELALKAIDEIVRKEPRLKYAPSIAYNTFISLLRTNQQKAYKYGKLILVTKTYEEPSYSVIYNVIQLCSDKLKISAEIYELAAEAYQIDIDKCPYPELLNLPKDYSKIAELYWHANNKLKAIETQQKAIKILKIKSDLSNIEMVTYQTQLEKYKKCNK